MVKEKGTEKKLDGDVKTAIDELIEKHRTHLYEIFADNTFTLTFDEREKMIGGKMKEEICKILEKHIEKDPMGVHKNEDNPDETCLCPCGTEAVLCRDKNGKPRIFEREIKTKDGLVKIQEYGYYCSKCRKVFFSPENT